MSTGMSKSKELRLIRRAACGDADAATMLIRTHQSSVFAYIRRMSGRDEVAEDVAQEAFTRVLVHLDRFDSKYRFSTWLFTIARRIYLNMVEKKKPVCDCDRLSNTVWTGSGVGENIEELESLEGEKAILDRALKSLSQDQREVLVLFHQHEWPIWQIADQMGIPEGTVKSHLFRGRVKLRDEFVRLESEARAKASDKCGAARFLRESPAATESLVAAARASVEPPSVQVLRAAAPKAESPKEIWS